MNIRIAYCVQWNYLPKAQVVASEIRGKWLLEANVELVEGSVGVFDVTMGEKILFSKNIERRFPNEGELIDLINNELNKEE